MKVIVLYEELSGYFLACINCFAEKYNADVYIFRKEVNAEAPFQLFSYSRIHFFYQSEFSERKLSEKIKEIGPDAIICGGWSTKMYMNVCRKYRSKIPVVLGFDNKWNNSLRQNIASILSSFTIQRAFTYCWVPGIKQKVFAKKLGFDEDHIFLNAYSADFNFFNRLCLSIKESKKISFPHRFIFTGRYFDFKGIRDLWKAFIELQNENPNDWELWCLGAGDIESVVHPKIKHFGFIQPDRIETFITETGVFVLPSTFEPWGVAVHEFAAAGFPLICSDEVGAAELFLKEGENGFLFEAGNVSGLKKVLRKIMSTPDPQLVVMGEKSAELARQITPDKWSETLMSVITKSK